MSDLIGRSALLNAFNNTGIQITFDLPVEEILGEDVDIDDFTMLVQDVIQVYKKMVIDTIEKQPTAFDTEKVVEQLMIIHDEGYCLNEDGLECILDKTCSDCYREKIIDIVKKGGAE